MYFSSLSSRNHSVKKRPAGSRPLDQERGQQWLKRDIDLEIRPVIMLEFRASQDGEILTVVLIMLGVQKIHIAEAKTNIRFEIVVIVDVPYLSIERIESYSAFAGGIIEIVAGRL